MGKLVLRLPDGSLREIPLERERITIGRRADNDVCLPYPAVSGAHAAVVTVLDDSFLEDLNSTNGTLVNGNAITKHFLRNRDEIDIGRHTLIYVSGEYSELLESHKPAQPADPRASGDRRGNDLDTTLPPPGSNRARPALPLVFSGLPAMPVEGERIDTGALFGTTPASTVESGGHGTPFNAPSIEVMDGPEAGRIVRLGGDDFVIGRLGAQVAAVRRTSDGYRLVQLEGDTPPRINGAELPDEGSLLARGDEIEIAGTRLLYRPA